MASSIIVKEQTDRETTRFTLEWTINKFKSLREKSEPLRSNGITMQELGQDNFEARWRICVEPRFKKTGDGDEKFYVGVFLRLTDAKRKSVSYTCDKSVDTEYLIRVNTGNETSLFASQRPLEHTFCRKEAQWGFPALLSHAKLFGDDKTPGLLKDDCLTFIMEVTMYGEPKAAKITRIVTVESSLNRYQQFARRQAKALASSQSPDFKIHSSDGQVFPTYQLLLTSHSPVFAAMLSHDSKEKQLSYCELEDIDGETVGVLLDYVHGCDIGKVTVSNAEKVLIMADKYEILDLRDVCEEILAQSVMGHNAAHYLVLASQRELVKLQEAALAAIPKNMGAVLQNSALHEVWKYDPELVQTIMERCSKKMRRNETS